ncbi:alkaline phosphatase family protein [Aureibaculum marinum]|uniref:Alkaline phosphatase family protein n=1 Tax=Aureibaculum marinum TaxID=2487930 RepID=A0A3N4P5L8_9FLAO|nr:alkaline phosphatase PafA [Aureibaculum marinum]RPD99930.1 alkaline phosphatase family protein [Aureibaculum marinum]
MKKLILFFVAFVLFFTGFSQTSTVEKPNFVNTTIDLKRPKLVIGIVVDQMRYDYLTRFYNKYGEGGFKRLLNSGYNFENAHYNYIPTYTAVGHTSIYTGTTPSNHGIIGNNWYDKAAKEYIYCVDDNDFNTVGAKKGGKKSPRRLMSTTIGDELKMAQNRRGKVIGVSIKDRSAILPAGHAADAAYWFEGGDDGKFITSTYYMDNLPKWVQNFNKNGKAKKYINSTWSTLYNIDSYTESIADNNPYEGLFKGKETPTFPYNLKKLKKENNNYSLLSATPFGNSIVKDFAQAAIVGEKLGQTDNVTDFLAVSFSSTDYVGHKFGVDSKEVQDTYLRLDKDLADFFDFLDKKVGKNNYTLFLTADHAAVQVPSYLETLKIPAGYFDSKTFKSKVNAFLLEKYKSEDLMENFSNFQIFLNKDKIKELKLDANEIAQNLADELINYDGIYKVVTARTMQTTNFTEGIMHLLQNGYNQKYSGDVLLIPNPATISYSKTGSTHGSGYNYDTHIPIIFYGKGIKHGASKGHVNVIDIAPTISSLLEVTFPNTNTGKVLEQVIED